MTRPILIRSAFVVSLDPAIGDIPGADILIEDGRIAGIGRQLGAEGAELIDATHMIAIPGLINAHIHTWQAALGGVGADWVPADYFRIIHGGIARFYTPEDNYLAGLFGALLQIHGGCTTLFDWCHNLRDAEMADASIDGLEESGIRAVFARGTAKPPPGPGQKPYWEIPYPAEEIKRLRRGRMASDDRLVTLAMAVLGPDLGTYEVARQDFRLAREYGLMTSAHTWGRARMVPDGMWRLQGEGLLGPDHNVSHGNHIEDDELKMILDAGCSVTSTPLTEMLDSDRPAVMGRVAALGHAPSIGSDTRPNFSGSMLGVMRFAFQHQRESDNRLLGAQKKWPPPEMTTKTRAALEWATIGGAKALRLDHRIGSLTPGKAADIVLIRSDGLHMAPFSPGSDPVQALVMAAEQSDIDTVLIAGRYAKKGGELVYPGIERLKTRLAQSRSRLFQVQGLTASAEEGK